MQQDNDKLNLLYQIGKTAMSEKELPHLLDQTMLMTQNILHSTTASILLVDEQTGELFFEAATGEIGRSLAKRHVKVKSGIAAWVADHCQPLIVNDVDRDSRFDGEIDEISGYVTKSILCVPLMIGGRCTGVIEIINKWSGEVFNNADLELLTAMASTTALSIENTRVHQAALNAYLSTIKLLSETVDAKDPYTSGHSERVSKYSVMAARSLKLSPREIQIIEYAGLLHDLGKIGIDEAILRKPGKLTSKEWAAMMNHPRVGATIIADIPILREVKQLVLYHHERYDGTGYPDRVRGEAIPLGSRLLAVADCYDTMTTDRPYRRALGITVALSELHKCSGTQFCPIAVEAFISGMETYETESKDKQESSEKAGPPDTVSSKHTRGEKR